MSQCVLQAMVCSAQHSYQCLSSCVSTGSDEDAWHNQDFLPLPMSESYKLPSRRNRSQPENPQHRQNMLSHDKPGRWAHDKHDQEDPEDDPTGSAAHPDLRQSSGHVEKALKDTGLDSSASGEEEEEKAQRHQRKKRKGGGSNGPGAAPQQGQGASDGNPFGSLVRNKDAGQGNNKHGR